MKTALALSLLLFTSSALAAVVGKDVSYKAGDTVMKGWLAYDDAVRGKRAGVLVVPEWWGANDYAVKPGDIKAKLRVFHGEADSLVPPAQVDAFKTEMDNAQADYMLVAYPGVKHTFTNREADSYAAQFGLPLKYDNAADTDSWTRTLEFLKATLK